MRRLVMIVFVILTVVSLLSSCSMNHQSDDIFQVEIHQGEQETVLSSISSKTHATTEMPDLAKLLERSDVIIKGQVLQQINQTRANPEGDKVNKYGQVIENALLTYYSFRVDESFLGDYAPGDVITVAVANYDVDDDGNGPIKAVFLEEGCSGIFCFAFNPIVTTEDNGDIPFLTSEWGIFTDEDGNGVFDSAKLTFEADKLPDIIIKVKG